MNIHFAKRELIEWRDQEQDGEKKQILRHAINYMEKLEKQLVAIHKMTHEWRRE